MDIRHLELLRELEARGSVTAVAAATFRTPSAVSQQLKAAQRELGARLVEPAGRGLRLTEAGLLLAGGGQQVATALAKVQADWDRFRATPTGTVRLAALPSAATFLLAGVLDRLEGTDIRLVCTDIDAAERAYAGLVVDHDIVVAHSLTPVPDGADGLTTVELVREPLDIAMSPDHPLAHRSSVTAQDLIDYDWIGVPVGFPFDTVRLAVEADTGAPVRVIQRLRDNRLIESIVATGRAVAVLPRFTTPSDRVALRPLTGIASARHVVAVLRPDRAERLAVRSVVDALVRVGAEYARQLGGAPLPTGT